MRRIVSVCFGCGSWVLIRLDPCYLQIPSQHLIITRFQMRECLLVLQHGLDLERIELHNDATQGALIKNVLLVGCFCCNVIRKIKLLQVD